MAADQFFGGTITIAGTSVGEILDVSGGGWSRKAIETTHSGTSSGWATFLASDIKRRKPLTVSLHLDTDTEIPETASASIVITFPDTKTWTFTGFVTETTDRMPLDDRMTTDIQIQPSGDLTMGP